MALEARDLSGGSLRFYEYCDKKVTAAQHTDDADGEQHWRKVFEFGIRYGCSRLSAVEVDGKIMNDMPVRMASKEAVRLCIGNPLNPPHEHNQPQITQARMAQLNQAWPSDTKLSGPLCSAPAPPRLNINNDAAISLS